MKTALREYQREALEWIYSSITEKGGAVCCLPTATGKTIVFIALAEKMLKEGLKRVLVLEPTRYLVVQTGQKFIDELSADGLSISYIYWGTKERSWESHIVVTTPESALSHFVENYYTGDRLPSDDFPLVIIDECHHTVGQDPFAKVVQHLQKSMKAGFSAMIVRRKKEEIERLIGPIRIWNFKELAGRGYEKPPMIADVYDSPLTGSEEELYKKLYDLHLREDEAAKYAAMAMTILARDGADALRDSASPDRHTGLAEFLRSINVLNTIPEIPHKLTILNNILRDYEDNYDKAMVFVHRVVTAETIAREFSRLRPVKIIGGLADPRVKEELLNLAKDPNVKLIVATAAGDEGLDIPEIDLLVFWSHMVAPTRFYQRLGRGLRLLKKNGIIKKAIFISTPETRDYDTLYESLYALEEEGIDVAGIFERLPIPPTEGKRLANVVAEYSSKIGSISVSYDTLRSRILGEDQMQYHIPEEIVYLRMISWKTFIDILLPEELRQYFKLEPVSKSEKRLRSQLVKSVSEGHLCYYYDIEVVSRYFERAALYLSVRGLGKIKLRLLPFMLGVEHRSYLKTEDLEKLYRERPECFSDRPLNITVKRGRVELANYYDCPYEIAEQISKMGSQVKVTLHPSITGYLIIDGNKIQSSVTAVYGPFMIKNRPQIECALRNASALFNLFR